MQVFGCEVTSRLDAAGAEGFSSMVHRGGDVRGPFLSLRDAVLCAQSWEQELTGVEPNTEQPVAPVESVEDSE